jgi:hypothetical protein
VNRLALAVLVGGCFSPSFLDGKGPCTQDSDCASGLHCAADKTCWHNGRDPLPQAGDLGDLGTLDMPPHTDSGVLACIVDTDTFDDGCFLSP